MTQVMKKTGCTCFLHNTLKFCIVSEILYTIVIKNERLSFFLHLSSCHIDSVAKEINMKIKNFRLLRGLLSISMILFLSSACQSTGTGNEPEAPPSTTEVTTSEVMTKKDEAVSFETAEETDSETVEETGYLDNIEVVNIEKIGSPISNMQISACCVGTNEDEDHIFYGISEGTLFAYNPDTNRLLDVVNVASSNALDMGPDGVINIASGKGFYRYDPAKKELKSYGSLSPETAVMHKGCFDSEGNYYFGTYPNAALFKYDIKSDMLVKIGTNMVSGNYIKSMASCGDSIFMGSLGSTDKPAEIKVYHAKTGIVSDVPNPVWKERGIVEDEVKQYYSMTGVGRYLFARFSCYTVDISYVLGVYDTETGRWTDFILGTQHLHSTDLDDEGLSYFRAEGKYGERTFISYNPETKERNDFDGLGSYNGAFISPVTVTLKDQKTYPGKTVIFGAGDQGIALFNLQNQSMQFIKDPLPHDSFPIRTIKGGYNDDIIVSSMASTKVVIYDVKNKAPRLELPLSQMEGINVFDGKYYLGAYGSEAALLEVDPKTGEITRLADMAGHNQNRAFVVEDGGDYILWGSIPNYGYRGGGIGLYHKRLGLKIVHSNVIADQSVVGLAYKDGIIYGSTTMFCGLGIEPVVDIAKVFTMDRKGNVLNQKDIRLKSDPNDQYFAGGMTFNKEGRLFVACPQTLIELDPLTLEIKNEMRIGETVIPASIFRWQPFALEWDDNGLLYTNIGGVISVVDVDAWKHKQLAPINTAMVTLGSDGNLYFMSDSNMMISRIRLSR
jgi:hypothetical protein